MPSRATINTPPGGIAPLLTPLNDTPGNFGFLGFFSLDNINVIAARNDGTFAILSSGSGGGASHGIQVFDVPGVFIFNPPDASVTQVFLTGAGAGGGGGGGSNAVGEFAGGGGAGGGPALMFAFPVTFGTPCTVTVGTRGIGGAINVAGTIGGDTTFFNGSGTINLSGGGGGFPGTALSGAGGSPGTNSINAEQGQNGGPSYRSVGGGALSDNISGRGGGNIAGGTGGVGSNIGTAGFNGLRGGGGYGGAASPIAGAGADGGDGFLILQW